MAASDTNGPLATGWTAAEKHDAFRSCSVPSSPADESLDRIVRHAAKTGGAAVAVIALSDGEALSIITQHGLDPQASLEEMDRILAYLKEGVGTGGPISKDPPAHNDLPGSGLKTRACMVLRTPDGDPVGALGLFDKHVRDLTDDQLEMLDLLSDQTMTLLEHRRMACRQRRLLQEAKREVSLGRKFEWLVAQSPEFVCAVNTEGFVVYLNEVASRIVGLPAGRRVEYELKELVAEEHHDAFANEVMPIILRGGVVERRLRLRNMRTRTSIPTLFTMFPIHGSDMRLIGYGVGSKEIAALEAEEQRRDHLIREGAHRMLNLVAMMNSIVNNTLRNQHDIEEARVSIRKRLDALGAAQSVLATASAADIVDVVRVALSPHDRNEGRFRISGPSVMLTAQQTQGLSLGLYELATNAVKYGSLSNETGTVTVDWSLSEAGAFNLEWTEAGGPSVSAPNTAGFGSTLVKRGIGPYFSGEVEQHFHPEGLRVALRGRLGL